MTSHYVPPPLKPQPLACDLRNPHYSIQPPELNLVHFSAEVDICGRRRDDDMYQDEASPMLREKIDATKKNDDTHPRWQRAWRMLAGGNRTVKSTCLNMESSISFKTFFEL